MEFSLRETAVLIAALRCLASLDAVPAGLELILEDAPGDGSSTLADECHDLADRINNED